ncbi:protein EURL homolog isoform X1 [Carcharodon carcharias]|uniref:protein EURL homolog isoform X1 n=2 Tax=Carcharodon carcharias TaxID=13397 RepID=UPI001B7F1792|nr:protein EURL homolog isoform X1 [Carcharodon carcharias]XP_041067717.1 protein EURL homolog isoform X1 [Carcharodon carcharias]XP_041067718.1 protein EURL homolog isoform X1 [Carcharodon carcharias]XP_041067719.1 protein EURL homolog isoform X1 [Carcharodon carcharias]XP_041067720.1 protein EURL homolog isoform X1 [Carcharodon carcharias]
MNEEQFVNIDLNDDNICGVCKLETAKEMLSFCHVCFELSIEGVARTNLLHTESMRGHRECFEKFHLIANQELPRSKASKSTYRDVKDILSRKISQIVQYAQNQPSHADLRDCRQGQVKGQEPEPGLFRTHLPQLSNSQLPRYSPRWLDGSSPGYSECRQGVLEQDAAGDFRLGILGAAASRFRGGDIRWSTEGLGQGTETQLAMGSCSMEARCHRHYTQEELSAMSVDDLLPLNEQLLKQIKVVFEDLAQELEKKDSLASELHVRYIAIEQLFKNRAKLPWLRLGRGGFKPSAPLDN